MVKAPALKSSNPAVHLYDGKLSVHYAIGGKILIKFFIAGLNTPFWLAAFLALVICILIATVVTFMLNVHVLDFLKDEQRSRIKSQIMA